jgi:hypothetical protein
MEEEYAESMPTRGKDESSPALRPCPKCGATMDLKRLEDFASRHISYDGRIYYCNNPICPPDEWERKQRLLLDRFRIDAM